MAVAARLQRRLPRSYRRYHHLCNTSRRRRRDLRLSLSPPLAVRAARRVQGRRHQMPGGGRGGVRAGCRGHVAPMTRRVAPRRAVTRGRVAAVAVRLRRVRCHPALYRLASCRCRLGWAHSPPVSTPRLALPALARHQGLALRHRALAHHPPALARRRLGLAPRAASHPPWWGRAAAPAAPQGNSFPMGRAHPLDRPLAPHPVLPPLLALARRRLMGSHRRTTSRGKYRTRLGRPATWGRRNRWRRARGDETAPKPTECRRQNS